MRKILVSYLFTPAPPPRRRCAKRILNVNDLAVCEENSSSGFYELEYHQAVGVHFFDVEAGRALTGQSAYGNKGNAADRAVRIDLQQKVRAGDGEFGEVIHIAYACDIAGQKVVDIQHIEVRLVVAGDFYKYPYRFGAFVCQDAHALKISARCAAAFVHKFRARGFDRDVAG